MNIEGEYPFYTKELKNISTNLFKSPAYGAVSLNTTAFGELFIIIHHIVQESVDMAIWREIHINNLHGKIIVLVYDHQSLNYSSLH